MVTVIISTELGDDKRLVLELPDDIPAGPVEVTVRTTSIQPTNDIRQKLATANFLVTDIYVPKGTVPLTDEELYELGKLPEDAASSEQLIDEDRGEF